MAEAVEKDPCPYPCPCTCTESPKESLPRPTEESTKPDENNTLPTNKTIEETSQLINSVFLSNIIEGFGNIKLESISDAKSLFTIDDMIKHTQSMNKTLKDKDTKEREKRMEEISKKIRNEIRTRNTQSEYLPREKEFDLLPRCSTHPANDQRQENPTIRIEISIPGAHAQAINTVEYHTQNNEETRLKCCHCCGVGAKKKSVENAEDPFSNTKL